MKDYSGADDGLKENKIRMPAVVGAFYPAEEKKLRNMIEGLMNLVEGDVITNLHGIIVPHAGYIYSGRTACRAFKTLSQNFDKVIILGPNHTVYTSAGVIDENEYWRTPFGNVKIEKIDGFEISSRPHHREHSIEVQVPFLQYVLKKEFTLVPIIIGDIDDKQASDFAKKIAPHCNEKTLLVVSSDLSHFHNLNAAKEIDGQTIKQILELKFNEINACGENPLKVLMKICEMKDWRINFIDYSTSADATKDEERVVGYASFWF